MTKILVTGASGSIGSALLPVLDDAGVDVWTVDRRPLDRSQHTVADLEDPASVQSLVGFGPDSVVHLAGALGSDVDQLFRANVLGTVNLLEALAPGTSVVVAGSAAEYGSGHGVPLSESDPLRPVSPYGWSKVAQSTVATAISERRSHRLTLVRPFNVVSSTPPVATALGNMRRQLEAQHDGRQVAVETGRLDVVRDYVPIAFVATVLGAIAQDAESTGTFNICSGVGLELGGILEAMGSIFNVDIVAKPDPALVALPAASIVTGDPSLLLDRFGLSVKPTEHSIAMLALGFDEPSVRSPSSDV